MTAMNISVLETLTRHALKGTNIVERAGDMLKGGAISSAEYRSLNSLSWQVAANVATNSGVSAGTVAIVTPTVRWL
jgi:hypothetical protein